MAGSIQENRNELAFGELNQRKLNTAKVAVIGSDIVAQYVLAGLAGLGVRNVSCIDNSYVSRESLDFLCYHALDSLGKKRVLQIERVLKWINPEVMYEGIHGKFTEAQVAEKETEPTILVDATNDPQSKENALRYAGRRKIPLISVSSNDTAGAVGVYRPGSGPLSLETVLMEDFCDESQGVYPSGVAAGIALEYVRKLVFLYEDGGKDELAPNDALMSYNVFADDRKHLDARGLAPIFHRAKKALVVGAGGIGNFVALNLALLNFGKVDVVDNDVVEAHNLNRQFLHYNSQGQRKSHVLSQRMKELDPVITAQPIDGFVGSVSMPRDRGWVEQAYAADKEKWDRRLDDALKAREELHAPYTSMDEFVKRYYGNGNGFIGEGRVQQGGYDIIFGCVDNKFARMWMNHFAVQNRIPYIDGGTSHDSGQVSLYIPGHTRCVDCQLRLKHMNPERARCADAEASVVMPNMIVGSLMVGEAVRLLHGIGTPRELSLKYKARLMPHFYTAAPRESDVSRMNHNCRG